MRIEFERYSTMMSAANKMFHDKHMNIYEYNREKTPEGRRVTFGVNWAGMGTKTPVDTKEFADNLKDAAAIAEILNRMEITYYYDENAPECDWDDLEKKIKKAIIRLNRFELADALYN